MNKCPSCNGEYQPPWNKSMFPCPHCKTYLHTKQIEGFGEGIKFLLVAMAIVAVSGLFGCIPIIAALFLGPKDVLDMKPHTTISIVVSVGYFVIFYASFIGLWRWALRRNLLNKYTIALDFYKKYLYERKTKYFVQKTCPKCQQELKIPRFNGVQYISKNNPLMCPQCTSVLIPASGQRKKFFLTIIGCFVLFLVPMMFLIMKGIGTNNVQMIIIACVLYPLYLAAIFAISRYYSHTLRLELKE